MACTTREVKNITVGSPVALEQIRLASASRPRKAVRSRLLAHTIHEDDLAVSVLGCPESVPDPWKSTELLHGALGELRVASGEVAEAGTATGYRHRA